MMGKTHIAVGIGTAYLACRPHSIPQFAAVTIGGCVGAVMADIDVKIDTRNIYAMKASMDALYGELLAIGLTLSFLIADWLGDRYLISAVMGHWQQSLIGLILFVILVVIDNYKEIKRF